MSQIARFQETPNQDHHNNFGKSSNPYILQNPNRCNGNGPDYREDVLRKLSTNRQNNQSQTNSLPDRKTSKNPFVNGSRVWSIKIDDPLCVRGGCFGKKSNDGHTCSFLPAWEQSYLRETVFGSSSQTNFAAVSYDEYDDASKVWEWPATIASSSSNSTLQIVTPAISNFSIVSTPSFSVNSISADMSGLGIYHHSPQLVETFSNKSSVETYLGEGSGEKKRASDADHLQKTVAPQKRQQSQYVDVKRQFFATASQIFPVQQNTYLPQQNFQSPQIFMTTFLQIPNQPQQPMMIGALPPDTPTNQTPQNQVGLYQLPILGKQKRKNQKRVNKKTESQPLINMFNDVFGKYAMSYRIRKLI